MTTTTTTANNCACQADKAHSSTSFNSNSNPSSSSFNSFNANQFQQQFTTGSGFAGQAHFGNIMNSMAFLQQIPVVPQVPGYPAFYAPDKIPKGAIIAFMPVVILPEAAYANCQENLNNKQQHAFDPLPLGVQPAPFPYGSSLNSIFPGGGGGRKDQCMCPCSCTQNIPDHSHKKRETDTETAAAVAPEGETTTVEEAAGSNAEASNVAKEVEEVPALVVEKDLKQSDEVQSVTNNGEDQRVATETKTNDTTESETTN